MSCWKTICLACALSVATALPSPAQTFTTLVNFDSTNGAGPRYVSRVQGTDGNLYGTTEASGGTVFKMTPKGALTTLYSFGAQSGANGSTPWSGLALGTDGSFYGTTIEGGSSTSCYGGCGTVFKIIPAGVATTLHSFDPAGGGSPSGALIQGTDGNFYGTTQIGGANNSCDNGGPTGCGTICKITSGGTLTTLHSFNGTDGWKPIAGLVQGTEGNFYGTTVLGGAYGGGTVFRMTPAGALTTLYNFCTQSGCTDGLSPFAPLIQASNGNFYGTTSGGGTNYCWFDQQGGTIFKITPRGGLTTLYSFCLSDGRTPESPLIRASDGKLYGTTRDGGNGNNCTSAFGDGCGTVFRIVPGGTLTTLHTFNLTDGDIVTGGLVQATNGKFYGTTWGGGANTEGTLFSEDVGLGPFITVVLP